MVDYERPHGIGLALFSCTPMDLWRPYVFHVRIADQAFDAWPDVAPLLALLEVHERYAVSLDALWRGASDFVPHTQLSEADAC